MKSTAPEPMSAIRLPILLKTVRACTLCADDLPMGFCYPGTGASGDLPPRKACAVQWRAQLLQEMPRIALTLVIGRFAMTWHLPAAKARSLTETVFAWRGYGPTLVPLPHPSPRNTIWLKAHPWFARDLVPALQQTVRAVQMAPA